MMFDLDVMLKWAVSVSTILFIGKVCKRPRASRVTGNRNEGPATTGRAPETHDS
ncbi:hypothetical protein D3C86_1863430 [compost metagenome]